MHKSSSILACFAIVAASVLAACSKTAEVPPSSTGDAASAPAAEAPAAPKSENVQGFSIGALLGHAR